MSKCRGGDRKELSSSERHGLGVELARSARLLRIYFITSFTESEKLRNQQHNILDSAENA